MKKGLYLALLISLLAFILGGCVSSEIENGKYRVSVTLTGGTGKASIDSPTEITVNENEITAKIVWSSSHYDYMIVNETKYFPINDSGNSVFEIPIEAFDKDINVIADTTAMSEPHEIEYVLNFSSESLVRNE